MKYDKITMNISEMAEIIDTANELIDQEKQNEAEQKLEKLADVQPKMKVIPIYCGSYFELQVDA